MTPPYYFSSINSINWLPCEDCLSPLLITTHSDLKSCRHVQHAARILCCTDACTPCQQCTHFKLYKGNAAAPGAAAAGLTSAPEKAGRKCMSVPSTGVSFSVFAKGCVLMTMCCAFSEFQESEAPPDA